MFAPMINPYEPSMTKEEMRRAWEEWLPRKKFMYFLARRFPKLLSFSYRRSFLSGKHGRIDKWMSLSLQKKVIYLIFLNNQNVPNIFNLLIALFILVMAVLGIESFMFLRI